MAPAAGSAPAMANGAASNASGTSPHGTYTVVTSNGSGGPSMAVTKTNGGQQLLQQSFPAADANWGFGGSDDHLFVLWWVDSNQQEGYDLYDLTSATPGKAITNVTGLNVSGLIPSFSPHASRLLVTATQGMDASLFVYDTSSGKQLYTDSFTLVSPPGKAGDTFGVEAWGWGPDAGDNRLLYAANVNPRPVLKVADLDTGNTGLMQQVTDTSERWLFSPCGDALAAWSTPATGGVDINLYSTTTGASLASDPEPTLTGSATISFKVASVSGSPENVVTINGTDHVLAPDTAATDCGGGGNPPPAQTPPGSPKTISVDTAVGAAIVTWTAPTTGDAPTKYDVSAWGSNGSTIEVPASQTSVHFDGLPTGSYTFSVTASNDAGTSDPTTSGAVHIDGAAACGVTAWSSGPTTGSATVPGANGGPTASFSYSVSGSTVILTNSSQGDGSNLTSTWSWGNGQYSSSLQSQQAAFPLTTAYDYPYWGDYLVTLNVTDGSNRTTSAYAIVHVTPDAAAGDDAFAAATPLQGSATSTGGLAGEVAGTTTNATCEAGEPGATGSNLSTVWYTFTPSVDGVFTAQGQLSVFSGTSVSALSTATPLNPSASTYGDPMVKLSAGVQYFLQVSSTTDGGDFDIPWRFDPPPGNDNFANAAALDFSSSGFVSGTTSGSTVEQNEPATPGGFPGHPDILLGTTWYTWTAPFTRAVTLWGPDSFDVYAQQQDGSLSLVTWTDDATSPVMHMQAGTTYYLRVYAYQGWIPENDSGYYSYPINVFGPYTLNWGVAPPNDTVDQAQDISGATGSIDGTTVYGTVDDFEYDAGMADIGGTVWYRWTAPSSGPIGFTTTSSTIHRPMSVVYTQDVDGTMTALAPIDIPTSTAQSVANTTVFDALAGTTYYIDVAGVHDEYYEDTVDGPFTLSWGAVQAPGAPAWAYAYAGDGTATVVWAAPSDADASSITGYAVTATPDVPGDDITVDAANQAASVTGLTDGTTYVFHVVALIGSVASAAVDTPPITPSPAANADISVSVSDEGNGQVAAGGGVTYTITATNNGPDDASSIEVSDELPQGLSQETYTANGNGGVQGFTSSGSGPLDDIVDLPSGSSVVYAVHAQVDADASGTLAYSVGLNPLDNIADPTPDDEYAEDDVTVSSAPIPVTPTIDWATPLSITYGTALSDAQLDAASSVSGTFSYSPDSGTVLSVGSHELDVTFTPDDPEHYTTATAHVTIDVAPATLTVTPDPQTMVFGQTDPTFSATVAGFVNGDDASVVTTAPACAAADPHTNVGTYTITCTGGVAANYTFDDSATATLTVGPAATSTSLAAASPAAGASSAQLSATVAAVAPSLAAVDEGSVTFDVSGSGGPVGAVSAPVSGGTATVSLSLAGVLAGSYVVTATYQPGADFETSSGSGQLTVAAQPTAAPAITALTSAQSALAAALTPTTSPSARLLLNDALSKVSDALDPSRWTASGAPVAGRPGGAVFTDIATAVTDIQRARVPSVASDVPVLLDAARDGAVAAVSQLPAGPRQAVANMSLAIGDALRRAGLSAAAVGSYEAAWALAQ